LNKKYVETYSAKVSKMATKKRAPRRNPKNCEIL